MKWIIGTCAVESAQISDEVAAFVSSLEKRWTEHEFVFKGSFDKANRTTIDSFRSIGMDTALHILDDVKSKYNLKTTTDIHEAWQAEEAAMYVDELQIPAFLCRQTDLILAAAKTGKMVNVKKAQWLQGSEMKSVIEKIEYVGNKNIQLIERGTSFGYQNVLVDFRNLLDMKKLGYPVIFDGTHSASPSTSYALIRAAAAVGVDGIFMEIHPNPDSALSDGSRSLLMDEAYINRIIQTTTDISRLI
jgi:2-dehydro-3-deoxyphosphooctonate aldolase (KDO 8-P synthase)